MALTRKFLTAMGIETEKVDEIITAHTETIDGLKEARDDLKTQLADAKKNSGDSEKLNKKIKDLETQLENKEPDAKYDGLKKEYDAYKAKVEGEKTAASKKSAYKALLKDIKVSEKWQDKILRLADLDSIELDKDGKLKNLDDLKAKSAEEYADYVEGTKTKGADESNPPDGAKTIYTMDEVKNMSTDEINKNWDAVQSALSKGE